MEDVVVEELRPLTSHRISGDTIRDTELHINPISMVYEPRCPF